jgi:uncharacterized spore protein YtfJ
MAASGGDLTDALTSSEAGAPSGGLDALVRLSDRLATAGHADRTVGTPRQVGDRTVFPLAEVWYGHGFGLGSGTSPGVSGPAALQSSPAGGLGGGGGGGGRLRPLAVVEVGPNGTRVHPVIDLAAIGLALAPLAVVALLRLWRR